MEKSTSKSRLSLKQIIDIILIILLVVFIVQNADNVKMRFLFFGFDLPLVIIIVITFFIGFLTSIVFLGKKGNEEKDYQGK